MCSGSAGCSAVLNAVGTEVSAICHISYIKSVLEVNTAAGDSASSFGALVAEGHFSSAFLSGFV